MLVNDQAEFRVVCLTKDEYKMNLQEEVLCIDKKKCKIAARPMQQGDQMGGIQIPNYGIIGIMTMGTHMFLVVITGRKYAAKMM